MSSYRSQEAEAIYNKVVKNGAELPDYVFRVRFQNYLFFDDPVGSRYELILAVSKLVNMACPSARRFCVQSADPNHLLGWANANDDWNVQMGQFRNEAGPFFESDGLIFIDEGQRWVVRQSHPMGLGVFAVDGNLDGEDARQLIAEYFFDKPKIISWLRGTTDKEIQIVQHLGRSYLETVLEKFS